MPIRVMLADDHQVFLQGLASLVRSAGLELIGVTSHRDQLLQMILDDPPDVAVVDIGMPGVNVPQLLAVLRERQMRTAVLVLTGDDGDLVEPLMAAGAMGYTLKDHAFDELLKAIHTVARGKMFISSQIASRLLGLSTKKRLPSPEPTLTSRQLEILQLIAAGDTSKRIGNKLGIHIKTVDNHRRILRDKFSVNSTAELVRLANERGLI